MSKREQAYEDYKKGLKYKEISKKYGIPLSTVKSWAARYWKHEKVATSDEKVATKTEKGCNQTDKKLQPKRQRGGQTGNKNAVKNPGGSAPLNNANAVKNGTYAEKYWEYISDDEKAMIDDMPDDEEIHLLDTLRSITIRERRHMEMLKRYKDLLDKSSDGLILKEELKSVINEYNKSEKCVKQTVEGNQTKVDAAEQMQIIEAELTRIQRVKLNAIKALSDMRNDKDRQINIGVSAEGIGNIKETVTIYLPDNGRD